MPGAAPPSAILDSRVLLVACAAVSAIMAYLLIGRGAVEITTDGIAHLETAQRLLDGRGFGPVEGRDATHYPPGYSMALAGLMSLGLPQLASVVLISWLSWIASLVGACVMFDRAGGDREKSWALAAVLAWLVVASPIVETATSVRTEPLFLALTIWGLLLAERWVRSDHAPLEALGVAVLGAVLVSVRYTGVFLVAAVALRVVQHGGGLRRVLGRLGVVAAAVVPTAVWFLVHQAGARADAPGASGSAVKVADVWHSAAGLGWVLTGYPYSIRSGPTVERLDPLAYPLLIVTGLAAAASAVWFLVRWWRARRPAPWRTRLAQAEATGNLLLVDFAAIYVAGMLLYRLPSGYSVLARYWFPVVVPVVVVVAAHLSHRRPRGTRSALVVTAFAGVMTVNLVVLAAWALR